MTRLRAQTIAVALGVLGLLLATSAPIGIVRDEGYYFRAARQYHSWLDQPAPFSDRTLQQIFGYNAEHPVLVKALMGCCWRLLCDVLPVFNEVTAMRLGAMLIVSAGMAALFLLGAAWFDRRVATVAVLLTLACPHVFYHAHLGCFDAPVMALGVLTTYGFWRALQTPRRWPYAALAWGLALSAKHNAVFFWPTLALATRVARALCGSTPPQGGPRAWRVLAGMLLVAPWVLYIFYPFGWHAPGPRLLSYYYFHLQHEHYPVEYMGTVYGSPPFPPLYPVALSLMTTPLSILGAGIAGLIACGSWLRHPDPTRVHVAALLLLNIVVPVLLICLPGVPIFGGTKHWLPAMPYFCLLAAWAVVRVADILAAQHLRRVAWAVVGVSVALPAYETARMHPAGHTYYNVAVGGRRGAAAAQLARTFWGGDAAALLPQLNDRCAPGDVIYTHRMNHDAFAAYQRSALLRADLQFTDDLAQADWALINEQTEYIDPLYEVWQRRQGDRRPVASLGIDGVAWVSLYGLGRRGPLLP